MTERASVGDEAHVLIERLSTHMEGVGHLPDGRVVFVPGALPDEEVRVELNQSKKRHARADLLSVERASDARVEPACPVFEECGGCACWHMEVTHEFEWKASAAYENIARSSGLKEGMPPPVFHRAKKPLGYRVRATIHCSSKSGKRLVGFRGQGSHDIIGLPSCAVLDPLVWRAYIVLRDDCPDWLEGRCLIERVSQTEVAVTFIKSEWTTKRTPESSLGAMFKRHEFIVGATLSVSRRRQHQLGRPAVEVPWIFGVYPDALKDLYVASGLFRQANVEMNRTLTQALSQWCEDLSPQARVVECFAGCGNLTFAIAPHVGEVIAYEAPGVSVDHGQRLAGLSGFTHVTFDEQDLMGERLAGRVVAEIQRADVLVLDPPRDGAKLVCEYLASDRGPQDVIYVSCDPGALGRDLRILSPFWDIHKIEMFDMFPKTAHLETMVWLKRKA